MRTSVTSAVQAYFYNLAAVALTVFVLRVGKPVLLPVAIAILVAFILLPVLIRIQGTGIGRIPAVLLTMLLGAAAIGGVGWVVISETKSLARELPTHKQEIKEKIDQVRGAGGPFSELVKMLNEISSEPKIPSTPEREVVVARLDEGSSAGRLIEPVLAALEPIAMAGVIAVLVVFVLIGREDLRSRLLAVTGRPRIVATVRVLGDSAQKVGRFLLFQLIVNTAVGVLFAIGLAVIGVPYAWLWGVLTAVLRFIPYVGVWVSVFFPLALTFATSSGWQNTLLVLGFFTLLDLFVSHVVEPVLFGHHTGVSPIALLLSTVFWTWVWGPVGLILATPLSVCLVAMGQHVPRLRSLALLLGNQPSLKPHVEFYQRLLANDTVGATGVATSVSRNGLPLAYDEVVIPALALARLDRRSGGLTAEEERGVYAAARQVVGNLQASAKSPVPAASGLVFIGAPAHDIVDELPIAMIADVLRREGHRFESLDASLLPGEVEERVLKTGAVAVVISVMPPGGLPQAAHLCRRLRKRFPELLIIPVWWGKETRYDQMLVRLRKHGASYLTTSLIQTCDQLRASWITPSPVAGPRHGEPSTRAIS